MLGKSAAGTVTRAWRPDGAILFGYGFRADPGGKILPQSFYFSGYPLSPADAPIVSQNYTGFRAGRPAPALWAEVARVDLATLPACQLFDPPANATASTGALAKPVARAPTWASIGRWKP